MHLVLTALLGSWTNIEEEAFTLVEVGTSIKANLVAVAQPRPRPAPRPAPKPAPKPKKEEAQPEVQTEDLETIIENLDKPVVSEEDIEDTVTEDEDRSPSRPSQAAAESEEQEGDTERFKLALEYYQRNQALVERNFNTGTAAQRQTFEGLVVRMKIFLDAEGRLKELTIIRSSGNQIFDAETERAVRRIKHFILPADPLIVERYFQEITMEFSLSP